MIQYKRRTRNVTILCGILIVLYQLQIATCSFNWGKYQKREELGEKPIVSPTGSLRDYMSILIDTKAVGKAAFFALGNGAAKSKSEGFEISDKEVSELISAFSTERASLSIEGNTYHLVSQSRIKVHGVSDSDGQGGFYAIRLHRYMMVGVYNKFTAKREHALEELTSLADHMRQYGY